MYAFLLSTAVIFVAELGDKSQLMAMTFAVVGDVVSPRQRGRYTGYLGSVFAVATTRRGRRRALSSPKGAEKAVNCMGS